MKRNIILISRLMHQLVNCYNNTTKDAREYEWQLIFQFQIVVISHKLTDCGSDVIFLEMFFTKSRNGFYTTLHWNHKNCRKFDSFCWSKPYKEEWWIKPRMRLILLLHKRRNLQCVQVAVSSALHQHDKDDNKSVAKRYWRLQRSRGH